MRRRGWALPVSVGALVSLLVVLGTLQFRWLGQVGETIAVQKRASLLRRGEALIGALEQEITRVYLWFMPDGDDAGSTTAELLVERWRSWREAGRSAPLVKRVLVVRRVDAPPGEPGFGVVAVDPVAGKVVDAGSAPELTELRQEIQAIFSIGMPPPPGWRNTSGGPVLFIQAPSFEDRAATGAPAVVVVVFDERYLVHTLLPALADEHLTAGDDASAVVAELRRGERSFWRWPSGSTVPDDGEHAPIPVMGIRPDLMTPALLAGIRPPPAHPPEGRPGTRRGGSVFRGRPGPPPGRGLGRGADSGPDERRGRFILSDGPGPGRPLRRPFGPGARAGWSLSVAYVAGPVDTLVNGLRRRNLGISLGILAVLGGAISVLALAFRRAQTLAERHREFLASMSHELRTPLTVIAAASENLRDGTVFEAQRVKEYGSLIRDESKRLTGMVDDVLRLAASHGGGRDLADHLRFQAVDLQALVDGLLESLHPEIRARGAEVDFPAGADDPVVVSGDPQALRQVVENLLSNALKYGGVSPRVTIRIEAGTSSGEKEVRLSVADRGLGIPAHEVRHIFEPFFRGQVATVQQIHGSGLGLSLVARIMRAHRGRVTVESVPDGGSCFVLHFPVTAGPVQS